MENRSLEQQVTTAGPDGFQVWGIPSAAKSVLRNLAVGDYMLLLESATLGGDFVYAGRVIGFPRGECRELSQYLWGEHRFPLILFLSGGLTDLSYPTFCEAFGYNPNWNPAGRTNRLKPESIQSSTYATEERFIHDLIHS
jgi:5-methylcytosine-specific restriction enzyme A